MRRTEEVVSVDPEVSSLALLLSSLPTRVEASRDVALEIYQRAKKEGLLSGRIALVHDPLRGPRALPDGSIEIPIEFAASLWAATLGLLVGEAADRVRQLRARGQPVEGGPPGWIVNRACVLVRRACEGRLNPWPRGAPTPRMAVGDGPANEEDLRWWVGRANGLFLDAMAYLAAHEAAHLVDQHHDALTDAIDIVKEDDLVRAAARAAGRDGVLRSPRAEAARASALVMEREADRAAREMMLGAGSSDALALPRGMAIVTLLASFLLLRSAPGALADSVHPDLDVRLRQTLEEIDADSLSEPGSDPDESDVHWAVAGHAMYFACLRWGIRIEPTEADLESHRTFALMLFDRIEAAKSAAAG